MGIADLIPGISGGTIAFLSGIYEDLLLGIQSIKLKNFRKIPWAFLLPLGSGIVAAFAAFTPLFNFLLKNYASDTYAFFFGVITASTLIFLKKVRLKKLWQWLFVGLGAAGVVMVSSSQATQATQFSFLFLVMSGALASSAMLLPGVSGSYVLYLLGVYPVAIGALSNQTDLFTLLLPLFIGIILGLLVFSRIINYFLSSHKFLTLSLLTGFMIGGVVQIWPFSKEVSFYPIFFALCGFAIVMGIELMLKMKTMRTSFKDKS